MTAIISVNGTIELEINVESRRSWAPALCEAFSEAWETLNDDYTQSIKLACANSRIKIDDNEHTDYILWKDAASQVLSSQNCSAANGNAPLTDAYLQASANSKLGGCHGALLFSPTPPIFVNLTLPSWSHVMSDSILAFERLTSAILVALLLRRSVFELSALEDQSYNALLHQMLGMICQKARSNAESLLRHLSSLRELSFFTSLENVLLYSEIMFALKIPFDLDAWEIAVQGLFYAHQLPILVSWLCRHNHHLVKMTNVTGQGVVISADLMPADIPPITRQIIAQCIGGELDLHISRLQILISLETLRQGKSQLYQFCNQIVIAKIASKYLESDKVVAALKKLGQLIGQVRQDKSTSFASSSTAFLSDYTHIRDQYDKIFGPSTTRFTLKQKATCANVEVVQ